MALAGVLWLGGGAMAQPGGAPWNNFGGPGGESCTECHFDRAAVEPSTALSLEGLRGSLERGAVYRLTVRLATPDLATAGFLLAVRREDGRPAGRFAVNNARTESLQAAVRSTETGTATSGGLAQWSFHWQAPEDGGGTVTFFLAANAANDDASPLGDTIHLRQWHRELP